MLIEGVSAFTSALEKERIPYAIIGGLAVFAYGGERTTFDVDFLVHGEHRANILKISHQLGLKVVHENQEVMQFSGSAQIDVLFANRPLSQDMLLRVHKIGELPYPVVRAEDLIALKIQAYKNDASREFVDKGDILTLMKNVSNLDFDKIKQYADLFSAWSEISDLKKRI